MVPGASQLTEIYCDGASRGNPGPSAIGVVVKQGGLVLAEISTKIENTTNNVAEYRALLAGLEMARTTGAKKIAIFMDSELVVRQIQGKYKVKKEHLQPLFGKAQALLKGLDWQINHIPRESNGDADRLANQALDS